MSELDVEELLKSELAKVRTPKAPPLKQFHAMLEHTMKLLPDIDDIVSAADKKDVQLRDAQAANNELIAQLEGLTADHEAAVRSRDGAIQANHALQLVNSAYKRDKDSAEKKLADLLLELEEHDAEIIRLKTRRNELLDAAGSYYGSFSYELGCVLTFPFRIFVGQSLFPHMH